MNASLPPQHPRDRNDQGWPTVREVEAMQRGRSWHRFRRFFERAFFSGMLLILVGLGVHVGLNGQFATTSRAAESEIDRIPLESEGRGDATLALAGEDRFEFEIFPDGEDLLGGPPMLGEEADPEQAGEVSAPLVVDELMEPEPVDAPSPGVASSAPKNASSRGGPKRLGILRLGKNRAWDIQAVYTYASVVWGLE